MDSLDPTTHAIPHGRRYHLQASSGTEMMSVSAQEPTSEREQWKVVFAAGDSKKRKAEDKDTDEVIVVANKKRKLKSDVDKEPTGVIYAANLSELEPTSRDILQGIQDLSRRLDLLMANEWVEALEVRVGSVETNLLKWLDELEQRLNECDAQWKSSKSLG
ncbi:uncharacterized protein F5891DRAFT_1199925 [Suillus fuscotomentosus]|uniref:Uncharacterized protein n=1 Tax=Suillus fuscotomentosus TaxID=1912939 RepID=A0AAD4DP12_9AGAM|nr:uncharacterized protein F5891DRAFT_1199925 [Suillus fuscotomentosus]KAG1887462.1 hypothetical protein F5891DRAFT_1199925 [Suillus fuscotomentosus]